MDSFWAARLLKQQGYRVTGVTFRLFPALTMAHDGAAADCSSEALRRAQDMARILSIPHHVLDLTEEFEERVVRDFIAQYGQGRTPNPCVRCNQHIKFGAFLKKALSMGADKVATGHYAIVEEGSHSIGLRKGLDRNKDQSYFLYAIDKDLLPRIIFPLGREKKHLLRETMSAQGWDSSRTRESQDVCFIPRNGHRQFLARHLPFKEGPIYHVDGRLLGRHRGIHLHTIGQRQGLGISYPEPLYVIEIRADEHALIVGPGTSLERKRLTASGINMLSPCCGAGEITAKVRYRQKEEPCSCTVRSGMLEVEFDSAVRGVTPGQSVVLYQRDLVLGGGVIETAFR